MLKFTTEVTQFTEVEVFLNPQFNWDEMVKEFSESIFKIDDLEELIAFAAQQIAINADHFIEGIGRVEELAFYEKPVDVFTEQPDTPIAFRKDSGCEPVGHLHKEEV